MKVYPFENEDPFKKWRLDTAVYISETVSHFDKSNLRQQCLDRLSSRPRTYFTDNKFVCTLLCSRYNGSFTGYFRHFDCKGHSLFVGADVGTNFSVGVIIL